MALNNIQQAFELIKKHKSVLITFKKDWTGDDLASSLALAGALKKINKEVDIVCHDFKPNKAVNFLPTSLVKKEIKHLQKFIISINTNQTKVGEFYYDDKHDKLNIYITPRDGQFNPEDVSTATSDFKYDVIVVINSPDLESLGAIFDKQPDFFYSTPKINLDSSARNEYFGDIDLVNIAAPSTAELVYELIKKYDESLIDEDIATYLLAGIILATKNFKTANITPQTLSAASYLVAHGARREQIIQNMYQNRYLSTLKLWGRVLSRLDNELDDKLVWSTISNQDFLDTSTNPEDIMDVIEELIVSMPKTEIIVLIYETIADKQSKIDCIVYSVKNIDSLSLCKIFDPTGNPEVARFSLANTSLSHAERKIIDEIKQKLQKI